MDAVTSHSHITDSGDASAAPVSPGKYDKLLTVSIPLQDASKPTTGTALVVLPNTIALNQALADRLNGLLKQEQKARIDLARVASDIRRQYLSENGTKYAPEFTAFWKTFRMEETFGKLPQFTKYASAGDLIQRVEQHHPEYAALLPGSIKALYALSQLKDGDLAEFLKSHSEQSQEKASPKRSSKKKGEKAPSGGSGEKKAKAPSERSGKKEVQCTTPITDTNVKDWVKAKENPQPEQAKEPFLKLAEIKIHGSFGTFAEDGSYAGKIDKTQVEELVAAIRSAVSAFDPSLVEVVTHEEKLLEGFNRGSRCPGGAGVKAWEAWVAQWLERMLRRKYNPLNRSTTGLLPATAANTAQKLGFEVVYAEPRRRPLRTRWERDLLTPTKTEFTYALARRFLALHGARRFIALDYRCQGNHEWREKQWGLDEKGKVGHHLLLETRHRLCELFLRGKLRDQITRTPDEVRAKLVELQNLLPVQFRDFDDARLTSLAERMVDDLAPAIR